MIFDESVKIFRTEVIEELSRKERTTTNDTNTLKTEISQLKERCFGQNQNSGNFNVDREKYAEITLELKKLKGEFAK